MAVHPPTPNQATVNWISPPSDVRELYAESARHIPASTSAVKWLASTGLRQSVNGLDGGVLDELSSQGLFACGGAHDSTGLIGHWSFEEGIGEWMTPLLGTTVTLW